MQIRRARSASGLYLELSTENGWVSVAKALTHINFHLPRRSTPGRATPSLWLLRRPMRARLTEAASGLEPETTNDARHRDPVRAGFVSRLHAV